MARGTLADRVENLENAVDSLRQLPARVGALEVRMSGVESQIVQLRHETRDGFSAMELRLEDLRADGGRQLTGAIDGLRKELFGAMGELRSEMSGAMGELRREMFGSMGELRDEMSGAMGELRNEMIGAMGELRNEISGAMDDLRNEMSVTAGQLRGELSAAVTELRVEIRTGDEETRRYMRLLFEEYVERIARTRESGPLPSRKRKRS